MKDEKRRQCWVWVTRPEYYLNQDGAEREDFEPSDSPGGGWWTCHKDTKKGDLALVYRSGERRDIAYLIEVASDAYRLRDEKPQGAVTWEDIDRLAAEAVEAGNPPGRRYDIVDNELAELERQMDALDSKIDGLVDYLERLEAEEVADVDDPVSALEACEQELDRLQTAQDDMWDRCQTVQDRRWEVLEEILSAAGFTSDVEIWEPSEFQGSWVCEWRSHIKFDSPLPLATMRGDQFLVDEFNGLRASFQHRAYRLTDAVWTRLVQHLTSNSPQERNAIEELLGVPVSRQLVLEEHIEGRLVENLEVLGIPGLRLHMETTKDGSTRSGRQYVCGKAGRIDLLCSDESGFVVVELKRARAGAGTASQIAAYVGWVAEHLASGDMVRGVVVSRGTDERFDYAVNAMPTISHVDLAGIAGQMGLSLQ